ncbi:hypothetical protein DFS34DRAFT_644827 [Phlyctochytrium arcticum]|nr:hypothetical protein DFS34DRAFT_644827 [Phlyctochytrium arcticum]
MAPRIPPSLSMASAALALAKSLPRSTSIPLAGRVPRSIVTSTQRTIQPSLIYTGASFLSSLIASPVLGQVSLSGGLVCVRSRLNSPGFARIFPPLARATSTSPASIKPPSIPAKGSVTANSSSSQSSPHSAATLKTLETLSNPEEFTPIMTSTLPTSSVTPQAKEGSPGAPSEPETLATTASLHPRFSTGWWRDWAVIFVVFGITGSSAVRIVKPLLANVFGVEGTFMDGPWLFRILYLCTTLPLYSTILILVGTLFGRGPYFKMVALRMWSRFLPQTLRQRLTGK